MTEMKYGNYSFVDPILYCGDQGCLSAGAQPLSVDVRNRVEYMVHAANLHDELLSALERCAEVIGHNSCSDGRTPNGFVIALDHARAAIQKANEQ